MVGSHLARLWTDRCDIYIRESAVDSETGRTGFSERKIYADLPCRISYRISFETVGAVRDVRNAATAAGQAVKLFLAPEVSIPAGSKIVVRRYGVEMVFARSGVPAVFEGHQEVRVERFQRWT